MAAISVFGASGYAGSHIIEAAAVRGLAVRAFSRGEVAEQVNDVAYVRGDLLSQPDRANAMTGVDTVIVAVSPRGDMLGQVRAAVAALAREADAAGVRLGVIGGAGSLHVAENGPLVVDEGFPEEFKPEALEMAAVLEDLRGSAESLDWFFVSPAAGFGSYNPGEYRGEYRVGGDVLLTDDDGNSDISGADFGVAVVDEIETPTHHRARFTVAY